MCSRDIVKFYSINNYGLQMSNENMLIHFYGYIKARKNVTLYYRQKPAPSDKTITRFVLDFQQKNRCASVSGSNIDLC